MTGKTWTPIKVINYVLDFQGHTVSNLNVTVTADGLHNDWHGNSIGMIATFVGNDDGIKNLKLKDCSLTVDAADKNVEVGGVIGKADRGFVNQITMDNVTITTNAGGSVGGLCGCYLWCYNGPMENKQMDVTMNNVTINAPKATVGALYGHLNDGGNTTMELTKVDCALKVPASTNAVKADTYFGSGSVKNFTVVSANITVDATGNDAIELDTIDNVEEYIRFVNKANEMGRSYRKGQTILVTADLDFTGKTVPAIKDMVFVLDFQGHTVSNLVSVVDNASGDVGLIANKVGNDGVNGVIKNVVLRNCSLTVNVAADASVQVGAVAGYCDRANVESATLENVTIKVNGAGVVGGVIGAKGWKGPGDITATIKDTVIDAPDATVGLLVGKQWNWGGNEESAPVNVKAADVTATVKSANEVTATTFVGDIGVTATVTVAEGLTATLVEDAKGYEEPKAPETNEPAPDTNEQPTTNESPKTGDATLALVALSVVSLLGLAFVAKKRA